MFQLDMFYQLFYQLIKKYHETIQKPRLRKKLHLPRLRPILLKTDHQLQELGRKELECKPFTLHFRPSDWSFDLMGGPPPALLDSILSCCDSASEADVTTEEKLAKSCFRKRVRNTSEKVFFCDEKRNVMMYAMMYTSRLN